MPNRMESRQLVDEGYVSRKEERKERRRGVNADNKRKRGEKHVDDFSMDVEDGMGQEAKSGSFRYSFITR
jgi:hypothetical protein